MVSHQSPPLHPSDLDAAEIHGVITAPSGKVDAIQLGKGIAVSSQSIMMLSVGRHSLIIHFGMIPVEELL